MSQASSIACKNSFLIIDEFGRSTSEFDGLALLTSFLEHDLLREELCPHILVSTHYLRLINLIPETKLVEHLVSKIQNPESFIIYNFCIIVSEI